MDHPRIGGEKFFPLDENFHRLGSPPRGRGKVLLELGKLRVDGITPAWAGKSMTLPSIANIRGDHPRVGGEKANQAELKRQERGSPPRGRGKEGTLQGGKHRHGITPAWAGKANWHCVRRPALRITPAQAGKSC